MSEPHTTPGTPWGHGRDVPVNPEGDASYWRARAEAAEAQCARLREALESTRQFCHTPAGQPCGLCEKMEAALNMDATAAQEFVERVRREGRREWWEALVATHYAVTGRQPAEGLKACDISHAICDYLTESGAAVFSPAMAKAMDERQRERDERVRREARAEMRERCALKIFSLLLNGPGSATADKHAAAIRALEVGE